LNLPCKEGKSTVHASGNYGTRHFRSGDWELVESGEKETPFEKYQRLQCEMKELLEEITQLKVRG
jgi:Dynamitin.